VTSFFGIKGTFLRFSRKRQDGFAPNFFSRFRRKHLLITTCIEKQCTRPLNILLQYLMPRLHMQVRQPGTERNACIKVFFLCCQVHAIYSLWRL